MPHLTTLEKVELAGIAATTAASSFLPALSAQIGALITGASLLLLLQGFCRDIWLWLAARRNPAPEAPRYAACMCVESTIGFTGIVIAAGLMAFRFGPVYPITQPWLTLVTAAVLATGFLIKDFVFEWSPWRIYREKNHATLHFRWRK